jgi:hypothetical protein
MPRQIRDWQISLWKLIIHVVGRAFAEDAFTPFVSLVTMISVRFAIPTEAVKQLKRRFLK